MRRGFTLIELLLVIGIIAILAGIVIYAINPARQLGSSRDATRRSDVHTIANALYQYAIDNNGAFPWGSSPPIAATQICDQDAEPGPGCQDLNILTTTLDYLVQIPRDPSLTAGTPGTAYTVQWITSSNRIRVCTTLAEADQQICIDK